MIDKKLLDKLHNSKIIDRRQVLWWQIGYEGRRLFSKEEFDENLKNVSYETYVLRNAKPVINKDGIKTKNINYKVWTKDEVPILLEDISLDGELIPSFASVKPMSHPNGAGNGWRSLSGFSQSQLPLSAYHSPHIRGVVIELTDDFLF